VLRIFAIQITIVAANDRADAAAGLIHSQFGVEIASAGIENQRTRATGGVMKPDVALNLRVARGKAKSVRCPVGGGVDSREYRFAGNDRQAIGALVIDRSAAERRSRQAQQADMQAAVEQARPSYDFCRACLCYLHEFSPRYRIALYENSVMKVETRLKTQLFLAGAPRVFSASNKIRT
jgi:hypothetical protein